MGQTRDHCGRPHDLGLPSQVTKKSAHVAAAEKMLVAERSKMGEMQEGMKDLRVRVCSPCSWHVQATPLHPCPPSHKPIHVLFCFTTSSTLDLKLKLKWAPFVPPSLPRRL